MHLPPLYPITDDRLETPLSAQVQRLGAAGYPLVQFRSKVLAPRVQFEELRIALEQAEADGGWPAICINDRADLAVLAVQAGLRPWGLHLGQGDLPPAQARALPGLGNLHLGTSTHGPETWDAVAPACDHAGLGPFRATATKGDHAAPIGLDGLARGCQALRGAGLAPVAIGGLTLRDALACFQAGAEALAMVGEVASAASPADLLWQVQTARWQARPAVAPGRGVVLIGGPGAGTSALGRALGARLGLPSLEAGLEPDLAPVPLPEGTLEAVADGWGSRQAEALAACLEAPAVVSLGAAAWEHPGVRERVRAAGFLVLWLAEVPERAWARVASTPQAPLAGGRAAFLKRWVRPGPGWWEAALVLPLGRPAPTLAAALTGTMEI